jgi:hypothetical protein
MYLSWSVGIWSTVPKTGKPGKSKENPSSAGDKCTKGNSDMTTESKDSDRKT